MPHSAALRVELRNEINDWMERLKLALLHVENQRRREGQFPPLPEDTCVWLPQGPNAELSMLTLKVWTLRYCITPEFLMDTLTLCFRNGRRYDPKDPDIRLGIPASIISGTAARNYVEEAVLKTFPNGENRKVASQPHPRILKQKLDYDNPDQALKEYAKGIAWARRTFEEQLTTVSTMNGRNYRKDPQQ